MDGQRPPSSPGVGESFRWTRDGEGDATRVALTGEIDENADFGELARTLSGDVTLDLGGVTRINSCGVREWVNFVRELGPPRVSQLRFERCSPMVVLQLNTIYNFRGPGRVISFLAPYVCESCQADEYRLLDVATHFAAGDREPPPFACNKCGGPLVFDELPERYLSFLAEEPGR